jgi:hypothetical protein
MKRRVVFAAACWLLASMVGCSSNPREAQLDAVIFTVNNTKAKLDIVKKKVTEALEKAAKANKNLTDADLKDAVAAAAELRNAGKAMQQIKEKTDSLKDSTTKEERDELIQKFRDKLQSALVGLDKAQSEVDDAIKKAEDRGPKEAVDELKKTLKLAQGEFEVLARQ